MTRRARWLVMAGCVPPRGGGGIPRYTTEMLAALVRRDDVEVWALASEGAREAVCSLVGDDERVATVNGRVPGVLQPAAEQRHPWTRRESFDVVLGTKHLVPVRTSAFRALTVHDMTLLDRPDDFSALKRRLLPGPYLRSISSADLLLCISQATRARVVAHAPDAAARTTVIGLATASALLAARPVASPALLGRRFVLVVGDGSARKNVDSVLAAWPAVRRLHPEVVLAMVGPKDWSGSQDNLLRTGLVESGAALALGHVPESMLRWCYENADVVVCPSITEGYGLPVVEGLDLGAPVIVSSDPAMLEAAAGRAAAVVEPLDVDGWVTALVAVLDRAPASRERYEPRSWDDVGEESVRAVHDVQASQGRSSASAGRP